MKLANARRNPYLESIICMRKNYMMSRIEVKLSCKNLTGKIIFSLYNTIVQYKNSSIPDERDEGVVTETEFIV